ncbi:MAG: hypothetical protein FJX42_11410 [Alphaproteobacteria bacterium]|nr:hypothetical protein [Alphaproteobacteria bacterium]
MKGLSVTLKPRGIKVILIHPGWVRTDMGGAGAHLGIEESVTAMRRIIAGVGPDDNGRFFNYDGTNIPW